MITRKAPQKYGHSLDLVFAPSWIVKCHIIMDWRRHFEPQPIPAKEEQSGYRVGADLWEQKRRNRILLPRRRWHDHCPYEPDSSITKNPSATASALALAELVPLRQRWPTPGQDDHEMIRTCISGALLGGLPRRRWSSLPLVATALALADQHRMVHFPFISRPIVNSFRIGGYKNVYNVPENTHSPHGPSFWNFVSITPRKGKGDAFYECNNLICLC
jgi:hypothetical protein